MSVFVVASVSSVVLAALVVLVLFGITRLFCLARRFFSARVLDDELVRRPGLGHELLRGVVVADDPATGVRHWSGPWIVGGLAAAAALRLAGIFLPFYRDLPGGQSITFADTMHYTAATWYLDIALLVVLGYLAFTRRSRIVSAVVVGYCTIAVQGLAVSATVFAVAHPVVGPGFCLIMASDAAEVVAGVAAVIAVIAGITSRFPPSARTVRLAVLSAVLLAAASTMNSVRSPGVPLWLFSPLSFQFAAAMALCLVVAGAVPLLAVAISDRAALYIAFGLVVAESISVARTLLDWAYTNVAIRQLHIENQLTLGFWLIAVAVGTLTALVLALHQTPHHANVVPLDTITT